MHLGREGPDLLLRRHHGAANTHLLLLTRGMTVGCSVVMAGLLAVTSSHLSTEPITTTEPPSLLCGWSCCQGAMGLGSAFPCMAAIVQAKTAAETIFHTIKRTPVIDSASKEGTVLTEAKGEIELKVREEAGRVRGSHPAPHTTVLSLSATAKGAVLAQRAPCVLPLLLRGWPMMWSRRT